jgi:mRNA interferase MazF
MQYTERFNSEKYFDMTAYLALRNIENQERKNYHMREDWVYRRGDIYLANLDPYIGSEQGGTRPVVVLQNNAGNFFSPTLIIAPITSRFGKHRDLPTHYYVENVRGLDGPALVLLEQLKTIDKRRVCKYIGKMSRRQVEEMGDIIEETVGNGRRISECEETP